MSGDSLSRLIYLVLLGVVVVSWFFAQKRQNLNKTLQQVILWVLLFSGVTILYGLKNDLRLQLAPQTSIEINGDQVILTRANDQHFYATLEINGHDILFVVDTGATDMVLSQQDAKTVGLDPDNLAYFGTASTANGEVATARIKLKEVVLGPYLDRNVTAWVNDGEMFGSLLGMSYLSRFERLEITGDTMTLTR